MMKSDVESGDKDPLLAGDDKEITPDKEVPYSIPKADMKEAAFWLFMLFIASVTMTVGNKVCNVRVVLRICVLWNNHVGF